MQGPLGPCKKQRFFGKKAFALDFSGRRPENSTYFQKDSILSTLKITCYTAISSFDWKNDLSNIDTRSRKWASKGPKIAKNAIFAVFGRKRPSTSFARAICHFFKMKSIKTFQKSFKNDPSHFKMTK